MATYYRGKAGLITDKFFEVIAPARITFLIDELEDVHIVRGEARPVHLVPVPVAGVATVLGAIGLSFAGSPAVLVAAFVLVFAAVVVAGAYWRMSPRTYELRASYRLFEVCLFRSTDATLFGQVSRGLMRALEHRRQRLERR
jgi:hypothetical protein